MTLSNGRVQDYPCVVSADCSRSPAVPYFGSQYDRYSPSHSSLQKGSDWPSISTIQIRRGTKRPQSAQLVSAVSCQVRSISTHSPTVAFLRGLGPNRRRALSLGRPLSACAQFGRRGIVDDEVVVAFGTTTTPYSRCAAPTETQPLRTSARTASGSRRKGSP